jgi:hypothetical protein
VRQTGQRCGHLRANRRPERRGGIGGVAAVLHHQVDALARARQVVEDGLKRRRGIGH